MEGGCQRRGVLLWRPKAHGSAPPITTDWAYALGWENQATHGPEEPVSYCDPSTHGGYSPSLTQDYPPGAGRSAIFLVHACAPAARTRIS